MTKTDAKLNLMLICRGVGARMSGMVHGREPVRRNHGYDVFPEQQSADACFKPYAVSEGCGAN
jgi:hypothetical protein